MEESGGPMRRYGVAAHERVADGRRSVRRSWRRNGGGRGHGWRVRKSSAVVRTATGETRFGGQRGHLHRRCARRTEETRRCGEWELQQAIFDRRAEDPPARRRRYALNRPSTKRSAHGKVQDRREIGFVPYCAQTSCAVLSRPCCFIRAHSKQHTLKPPPSSCVVVPALCSAISASATDRRQRSRCPDGTSRLCSRNTTRPVQDMTRR
jgi:hypothetical protein